MPGTLSFEQLNKPTVFKQFLMQYHQILASKLKFPNLKIQKSLHDAAPIFGNTNWHDMSENLRDIQNHNNQLTALGHFLDDWDEEADFDDVIFSLTYGQTDSITIWAPFKDWSGEQVATAIIDHVKELNDAQWHEPPTSRKDTNHVLL